MTSDEDLMLQFQNGSREALRGYSRVTASRCTGSSAANARHTEEMLKQILATRTGKLSDVLEVTEKIAQVRDEIERGEAEQKNLNNRISLATVTLQVTEDYRAPFAGAIAPSVGTRLSNSAANGLQRAFDAMIGAMQLILTAGPTLLLLGLVFGLPAYFFWKKHRR